MAVSPVQIAENSAPNTDVALTATFSGTAVAGNLIFLAIALNDPRTIATPTDFTKIEEVTAVAGANLDAACFYKIATGNELQVVGSWTTSGANARIVMIEYSGLTAASVFDVSANNTRVVNNATATCSTGAVTNTDTSAFAIVFIAGDAAAQFSAGRTYTPGFTEHVWSSNTVQNARAGIGIAAKELTATGTLQAVFNSSGTVVGDELYGAIAVFKQTTSAPGAPATFLFTRMLMGHGK